MVNCEKLLESNQAADMKEFNSEPVVKSYPLGFFSRSVLVGFPGG